MHAFSQRPDRQHFSHFGRRLLRRAARSGDYVSTFPAIYLIVHYLQRRVSNHMNSVLKHCSVREIVTDAFARFSRIAVNTL